MTLNELVARVVTERYGPVVVDPGLRAITEQMVREIVRSALEEMKFNIDVNGNICLTLP